MNYTTDISNHFLVTDLKYAYSISIPTLFTLDEANYLKQLLEENSWLLNCLSQQLKLKKAEIILDFRKTTFIDNEGLIGLLQILNFARNSKINLTFSNFSKEVKMVLSLIGLERAFDL